jgi:hypothetical protein
LYSEAGAYFETTKHHFILKSNGHAAWIVHYTEGAIPPIRFGVLFGECVFNMRSALDNLVCGLIRTKDLHAACKGKFPICSTEELWDKNRQKHLKGVEPAAPKMIKDLQPCFRMSAVPENDALSILNVLCNTDNHRAVNLTLEPLDSSRQNLRIDPSESIQSTSATRWASCQLPAFSGQL